MNRERLEEIKRIYGNDARFLVPLINALLENDEPINKWRVCPSCGDKYYGANPHFGCKSEIRPKKGELWETENGSKCMVISPESVLWIRESGVISGAVISSMVHGRNGWNRIYPPMEGGK